MAAEDTNTENNYTAELVKKTVDVLNSKENIDLFTQFAWEICGAESDFSTPVKLEENEANLIQPGLKDIIFTKIATLGHRDKFPRQYDWENLIPTLAADEELFWIAHKYPVRTICEIHQVLRKRPAGFLSWPARCSFCCGTRKHIWCPEGDVSISYQPFASRHLRPCRSRMEIFPSIRTS